MKHLGKRLLAVGLSAAMVLGSTGVVNATTVSGSIDCTGWWAAFSNGIEITENLVTVTFTNTTYASATGNYQTPDYIIYSADAAYDSSTDGTYVNATSGYSEYLVARSDLYAWSGDWNSNSTSSAWTNSNISSISYSADTDPWAAWLAANKAGMNYTVTAKKSDNSVILTITDAYGVSSTSTIALASDVTMYLSLSGQECTLSDITIDGAAASQTSLDCTGWWTNFSNGIEITEDGMTVTFTNTTYSTATSNWCTPDFIIYSADAAYDGTVSDITTISNYSEYLVARSDTYAWNGSWNTNDTSQAYANSNISSITYSSTDTWGAWLAANKAGMNYTVTAKKVNGTVVFTTADAFGLSSTTTITLAEDVTMYLSLSGESCVLSNISYTYEADASGVVSFLGGSLYMADTTQYTSTGLRFGYTITLPDDATLTSWSWNWGTDADSLTKSLTGANKVVDEDTGVITTNLVITSIPSTSYDTTIYSQLVVTYELNGVTYTVTDSVQNRSVDGVATAISNSGVATDAEKTYAAGILAN